MSKRCLVCVLVCLGFGCGEPFDQGQSRTLEQPIIFKSDAKGNSVNWNVHQSRWFLRRGFEGSDVVHHDFGKNSREEQREFQLAARSRATGRLFVGDEGWRYENEACVKKPGYISTSSLNLVGDYTALTAYHSISGSSKETRFKVSMEGTSDETSSPLASNDGYWWFDCFDNPDCQIDDEAGRYDKFIHFVASEDDLYPDAPFSYNRIQENPLLSERLFQLSFHGKEEGSSLDDWSDKSFGYSVRKALWHSWGVKIAEEPARYIKGEPSRDVAVLEFEGLTFLCDEPQPQSCEAKMEYSNSKLNLGYGAFSFSSPAPLFNSHILPIRPELGVSDDTDVWTFHYQQFPYEDMKDDGTPESLQDDVYTSVVSNPGFLSPSPYEGRNKGYCENLNFGALEPEVFVVDTSYSRAAIDAKAGSSGGVVTMCPTAECYGYVDGGYENRRMFPVLSLYGHMSAIWDEATKAEWGLPGRYSEDRFAAVTGTVSRAETKVDVPNEYEVTRCTDSTCFNRLPVCTNVVFVESEVACTTNCTNNEVCGETGICGSYVCDSWGWSSSGMVDGQTFFGPKPAPVYYDYGESGGKPTYKGKEQTVSCGRLMRKVPAKVPDSVASSNPSTRNMVPAVMQGLRGFSHRDGGIATLKPICDIWEPISFIHNWRWLRSHGPQSSSSVENPYSFKTHRLAKSMLTEYYRDEEAGALRGAPMKMCPVNTVMSGIQFKKAEEGFDANISGILGLECTFTSQSNESGTFTVYLDENEYQEYGYEIGNRPYRLTQRIGDVSTAEADVLRVSCGEGGAITALTIRSNGNGNVTGIWIDDCIQSP